MNFKFWTNTFLHAVVPGGIGYRRALRKYRDAGFRWENSLGAARKKHQGAKGWKSAFAKEGFTYRDYASYEEYVEHQGAKFDEIIKLNGGFDAKTTLKYRLQFFDRFKDLSRFLKKDANVLCVGARQGTEVEVLRELGFHRARGIDLNPGPNNPLVSKGDFLHLEDADDSLDLLYSNAVDHAFDLDSLFKEHSRVIKADGYVYYDIALQEGGVFEAVHWASDEALFQLMLKYFRTVEMVRVDASRRWKSVLLQGKARAQ